MHAEVAKQPGRKESVSRKARSRAIQHLPGSVGSAATRRCREKRAREWKSAPVQLSSGTLVNTRTRARGKQESASDNGMRTRVRRVSRATERYLRWPRIRRRARTPGDLSPQSRCAIRMLTPN